MGRKNRRDSGAGDPEIVYDDGPGIYSWLFWVYFLTQYYTRNF